MTAAKVALPSTHVHPWSLVNYQSFVTLHFHMSRKKQNVVCCCIPLFKNRFSFLNLRFIVSMYIIILLLASLILAEELVNILLNDYFELSSPKSINGLVIYHLMMIKVSFILTTLVFLVYWGSYLLFTLNAEI